jgi:hypothetical protein
MKGNEISVKELRPDAVEWLGKLHQTMLVKEYGKGSVRNYCQEMTLLFVDSGRYWLFVTFGESSGFKDTILRSSSNPALPYIHRLIFFSLFTCPSPEPAVTRPAPQLYNPNECPCCRKETMQTIMRFNRRGPPPNWQQLAKNLLECIITKEE